MANQPNPTTPTKSDLATAAADTLPATKETEKAQVVKAKPEDPYKPINIKVVHYLKLKESGTGYEKAKDADNFKGVVISFDMPTDANNSTEYEFQHFNKALFTNNQLKTFNLIELKGNDPKNDEFLIEKGDNDLLYYFLDTGGLKITVNKCAKNYLVQARRKKADNTFSDWGTELHTEFMINGKGQIFGGDVDVTYSTRKQSVGMTESKSFKIKYASIRKSEMGKNLPAQIFEDKPESTLMGVTVEVSKLNYNLRNKNFQLAVSLKTNDIDLSTDDKKLEYCNDVLGIEQNAAERKKDYPKLTSNEEMKKTLETAKKVQETGLELFPGVVIKEINFAVEITDETPTLSIV